MARNREKVGSLTRQVQLALDAKLHIGESKHAAKIAGTAKDGIYSWSTYQSYIKHSNYFTDYCKTEHNCRTLQECRQYVDEWLASRSHLSAYTQKLEASALAKLYGCSTKDFVETESRHRSEISRSRGEAVRDRNFNEVRHSELVSFCRSTGLRRSELSALTGDQLIYKDGSPFIGTVGKGGRYREAPVIGDVDLVVRMCQAAGSGKVFDHVSTNADIHGYRADYATAIYAASAREISEIPYDKVNRGSGRLYQSEVYCCRGELKGVKLDKAAMAAASAALGHNRISVVAAHYIRGIGSTKVKEALEDDE